LGYNRIGPETLGDQRRSNTGSSEPLLNDVQQALLWQALQQPPIESGQWNGRKVADWMAQCVYGHLQMSRLLIGVLTVKGEVQDVLIKRCRQIIDQPDFIRGLTNFYWWPQLGD
jgi:hypothetical protein